MADATEGIVDGLIRLSRTIDRISLSIGKAASWLIVVAVAVSSVNAIVRKVFDISSNAWLELQWVLFSAVFLLCAAWALLANEHIRIDILSAYYSKRVRNLIELLGHAVFLLPLCAIMLVTSLPFFLASVRINEQSASAGGLPQWPAKSLVFIGFALLCVQGVSELIKRVAIMRGDLPDPSVVVGQAHATAAADAVNMATEADEHKQR
jgi:TRAP-type mannitol/chloroaromatic compound transport system permease small subunit